MNQTLNRKDVKDAKGGGHGPEATHGKPGQAGHSNGNTNTSTQRATEEN